MSDNRAPPVLDSSPVPIWKVTAQGPARISESRLQAYDLLERELEDWILADPSLLGEPLLIIGQQVIIPDVKDRLDLLALDPQGNAVVVELKRGELKDPVDMQALRYASYISKWTYEDFERQASAHLAGDRASDFNFNQRYEQFCAEAGVDEVPDLNIDQRVILVGSEIRDRLGSVALWLREHSVDIKVIEIESYREGEAILLRPNTIIPFPVSRFSQTGVAPTGDLSRPWKSDARDWHLEKRCSPTTKQMMLDLDGRIQQHLDVEPSWNQKSYVAYRVGNNNWLVVITAAVALRLHFHVKADRFSQSELVQELGVEVFATDEPLSEKLGLPSSVVVQNRSETTDRIILRIKEDFNLETEAFLAFLKRTHEAFPR